MHFIQKIVFNRTVSGLIVLLELLTVLLEYIDLFLIQNFDNQRFIALVVCHKKSSHYATIMLSGTYHAQNYASIVGGSLPALILSWTCPSVNLLTTLEQEVE